MSHDLKTVVVVGASRGISAAITVITATIDWLLSLPPSVDVPELNLWQRSYGLQK